MPGQYVLAWHRASGVYMSGSKSAWYMWAQLNITIAKAHRSLAIAKTRLCRLNFFHRIAERMAASAHLSMYCTSTLKPVVAVLLSGCLS